MWLRLCPDLGLGHASCGSFFRRLRQCPATQVGPLGCARTQNVACLLLQAPRVQSGGCSPAGGAAVTPPVHTLASGKVTGTILRWRFGSTAPNCIPHSVRPHWTRRRSSSRPAHFHRLHCEHGRRKVDEGGERGPAVILESAPTLVARAGSCFHGPAHAEPELLQAKPIPHGSLQPRLVEKIERQIFARKHSQRRVPGIGHQF